jgi:hypothetical protein
MMIFGVRWGKPKSGIHENITNPRNPPGGRVSGVSMTFERIPDLGFLEGKHKLSVLLGET